MLTIGPTGPNGEWQPGDHAQINPFQVVELDADQAALLNQNIRERELKAQAAEFTRLPFLLERRCPKCGYGGKPAKVRYSPPNAPCAVEHGETEHLARKCRRCEYVWPENCVEVG